MKQLKLFEVPIAETTIYYIARPYLKCGNKLGDPTLYKQSWPNDKVQFWINYMKSEKDYKILKIIKDGVEIPIS